MKPHLPHPSHQPSPSPTSIMKLSIQTQKKTLSHLKTFINPLLLQNLRTLEKQIQRLSIVNISENCFQNNKKLLEEFIQQSESEKQRGTQKQGYGQLGLELEGKSQQQNNDKVMKVTQLDKGNHKGIKVGQSITQQLSNIQQLQVLKSITTKTYQPLSSETQPKTQQIHSPKSLLQNNLSPSPQFSPSLYIQQQQMSLLPLVTESTTFPLLNRYLRLKASLLNKLIQLNPEKRHSNTLLVSHQRVMLKQHLDATRRLVEGVERKNQEIEKEMDRDFVLVKSKWEESERECRKLGIQRMEDLNH